SAVRRGRPWTTTACAPNTYQRHPRVANAPASAPRSSAGAGRDTPQDLEDAEVRGQILLPLAGRRPVRAHGQDLAAQLVRDADAGRRPMRALVIAPVALLAPGSGGPVPIEE